MKNLTVLSLCALMLLAPACGQRRNNNGRCCGSTLYQGAPCGQPVCASTCATPACTTGSCPAPVTVVEPACTTGSCSTGTCPVAAPVETVETAKAPAAEYQDEAMDDLDLDEDLSEPAVATEDEQAAQK